MQLVTLGVSEPLTFLVALGCLYLILLCTEKLAQLFRRASK